MAEDDTPVQSEITFRKGERVSYKNPNNSSSPVSATVLVVHADSSDEVYYTIKLDSKAGELQTDRNCLTAIVSKPPNNPSGISFDDIQRQIELLESTKLSNERLNEQLSAQWEELLESSKEAAIALAKRIWIGRRSEVPLGKISARKAAKESDGRFGHQLLAKVAKRLANNENPFPPRGRHALKGSKDFMDMAINAADEAEARGDNPRQTRGANRQKKSSIPGSVSSQGMIPGTDHAFFNRLFKEFMLKHFGITPSKPLSQYHVSELNSVVFPVTVFSLKEDRINERRLEANSCPYNFVSGAAGIYALWNLKPGIPGKAGDDNLDSRMKEEGYDPRDIINIDKSAHLMGKSQKKDKIMTSKKWKKAKTKRNQSTTTAATGNGEVAATLGYTLVTCASGEATIHITHIVDESVEELTIHRLDGSSINSECAKFLVLSSPRTDKKEESSALIDGIILPHLIERRKTRILNMKINPTSSMYVGDDKVGDVSVSDEDLNKMIIFFDGELNNLDTFMKHTDAELSALKIVLVKLAAACSKTTQPNDIMRMFMNFHKWYSG